MRLFYDVNGSFQNLRLVKNFKLRRVTKMSAITKIFNA